MKKYHAFIIFLFIISGNLFAHDFIWGENMSQFIDDYGKPYQIFEEGNIISMFYLYPIFTRIYIFSTNGLIGVDDEYGPFYDITEAMGISKMLLDNLFSKYTHVEDKESNGELIFIFKYGNDTIQKRLFKGKDGRVRISIGYFSPLALKTLNNMF